jgi:hypothetical protein
MAYPACDRVGGWYIMNHITVKERPMRVFFPAVAALTVLLWVLSFSAAASEDESDHAKLKHEFVRITSGSLHPKVQRIGKGDAFGWVNYSSKVARVSFDGDVASKMMCTTRTSFHLTGDRLESGDIQGHQFATLCNLASGEYAYLVQLRSGAGSSSGLGRTLKGTLIVE